MITILALALLAAVSIWGTIDMLSQINRNERERKKSNWVSKGIDSRKERGGKAYQGDCPRDRKILFLHLFSFKE